MVWLGGLGRGGGEEGRGGGGEKYRSTSSPLSFSMLKMWVVVGE